MKIVVSWLRELCPTELAAGDLADLLTAKGAEVETVERPWAGLSGVVVARVLDVADHPGADTLCVANVDAGGAGRLDVVVGVRNMGPGDLVPFAPPGARVPVLAEPLGAREIRGVVSNGMLCSPHELGISGDHGGILVLDEDLAPGADLQAALGLDDAVLDIEVTPNRPDFLSVLGIAREVSAATGTPLVPPDTAVTEDDEPAGAVATVEVLDLERCPRYLTRILRGVRHVPAPIRTQARLTAAGMRPISAVVDATNYAMLEIGQPLHPFDLALLKGPGIVVRRAEDGERLVTLDGVERTFTGDDLLICDAERPVAVAGVMGGRVAEVSEDTEEILLESAAFERGGVQRTRRRIDLSTEASVRFERGVDPEAPPAGADRACRLMADWCGARVLRGVIEVGGAPPRRRIPMRASRASLVIGYPVTVAEAGEVLDRVGMAHETEDDDRLTVEVPGYRVDLEREIDLIEEVVRVQGYERVGSTLPAVRQAGGLPDRYAFTRRVRRAMAGAGLREVRLIPFVSARDLEATGDAEDAIGVTNPLAADEGFLRTHLAVPGLVRALQRNVHRDVRSAALFEIGTIFRMADGAPQERLRAAFAMTGAAEPGWDGRPRDFDAFDAKGVVEHALASLGVEWTVGDPPGSPFHPGRSAFVMVGGAPAGVVGEIHPDVAAAYDVPGRIAAGELSIEVLQANAPGLFEARDVPRFPPVRRDLAFVVRDDTSAGAVRAALEDAAGALLGAAMLFDVFTGPPLEAGAKSLAFALELRAPDRTLTDREAEEVVSRIVDRLAADFGATLRAG